MRSFERSSSRSGTKTQKSSSRRSQQRSASQKTSWTGWGPTQFPKTRKVAGWEWNDHLQAYVSNAPRKFACECGGEHDAPSGYQRCKCGKAYNSYYIGSQGENRQATVDKYIVREIPVRAGVIVAGKNVGGVVPSGDGDNLASDTEPPRVRGVQRRTGSISGQGYYESDGEKSHRRSASAQGQSLETIHQRKDRNVSRVSGSLIGGRRAMDSSCIDGDGIPRPRRRSSGSSSQRGLSRQSSRESRVRDISSEQSRYGSTRNSVAAEEDSLSSGTPSRRPESSSLSTKTRTSALSGMRLGILRDLEGRVRRLEGVVGSELPEAHGSIGLIDPRTGKLHRLIDPGELKDGEDTNTPTMKKMPKDWSRRGDGAKWTKSPIGS